MCHLLCVVPAPRQWSEGAWSVTLCLCCLVVPCGLACLVAVWGRAACVSPSWRGACPAAVVRRRAVCELCASVGLPPRVGGGVLPRGVVPILARGAARQVLRGHRSVAAPCLSPSWRGACPAAVGRRRAVCEPRASGGSPCGLVRLVACRARLVCNFLGVVPALRLWAEGARSVTFVGRSATMRFSESSTQSTPMASWRGRMSVFFGEGRKRDANLDMVHVPVDLTAVFTE